MTKARQREHRLMVVVLALPLVYALLAYLISGLRCLLSAYVLGLALLELVWRPDRRGRAPR